MRDLTDGATLIEENDCFSERHLFALSDWQRLTSQAGKVEDVEAEKRDSPP